MEFNEKLLTLRKQKGLTQDELAEILFVSRTAISKWESGRGLPNLESLKAISSFFKISIDELLSSNELIIIAEQDKSKKLMCMKDIVFALLDCCVSLLLLLPLFGEKIKDVVYEVSIFNLNSIQPALKTGYITLIFLVILFGLFMLTLQNFKNVHWLNYKYYISIFLNIALVILFTISQQPYASVFVLSFLIIKVIMMIKQQ